MTFRYHGDELNVLGYGMKNVNIELWLPGVAVVGTLLYAIYLVSVI